MTTVAAIEHDPQIIREAEEEARVFIRLIMRSDNPLAAMLAIKSMVSDASVNGGEPPPYLIYTTNVAMHLRRCERKRAKETAN
jgi:hypothetical protein